MYRQNVNIYIHIFTFTSTRKQNGKKALTETSTTVSSPWKRGYRAPKKKMERTGSPESE
jgi:hypothetical protein